MVVGQGEEGTQGRRRTETLTSTPDSRYFSAVVVFLSNAMVMVKSLFHRELSPGQSPRVTRQDLPAGAARRVSRAEGPFRGRRGLHRLRAVDWCAL